MWLFTAAYTQIRLDATVLVLYKQRHLATPILGTRAHVPSKVWAGGDVFLYPLNMEWWLGICLSNYSSNMFLLSNQLWLINLTKCRNFELKCTKMRELKRFPDPRLSKEGDKGGWSCFTAREPRGGKGLKQKGRDVDVPSNVGSRSRPLCKTQTTTQDRCKHYIFK